MENTNLPNWVERIQKLIASKYLDPMTLEEFISDHENQDLDDIYDNAPDLDDSRFDYYRTIQQQLRHEGWTRIETSLFDDYPAPYEVLIDKLKETCYRDLGFEYFVEDNDSFIIMDTWEDLKDWVSECLHEGNTLDELKDLFTGEHSNITEDDIDSAYEALNDEEDEF